MRLALFLGLLILLSVGCVILLSVGYVNNLNGLKKCHALLHEEDRAFHLMSDQTPGSELYRVYLLEANASLEEYCSCCDYENSTKSYCRIVGEIYNVAYNAYYVERIGG
jgi:hypothetical protein